MERQFFFALLTLVSVAFLWLLKPFFAPIFWAIAVTIVFYPVQLWLFKKLPGRRNLNAFLTLCICFFVVVIPIIITVSTVVDQLSDFYQKIKDDEIDINQYVEKTKDALPVLQSWLDRINVDLEGAKQKFSDGAVSAGKAIAKNSLAIGQNTFALALDVGVMLYITFFFLRDGKSILGLLYKAMPLGDERERLLFKKIAEVTRATVKGNMVVSIVQGSLGGIAFALLGIPAAFLCGVLMAICSLIPAIGAAIVWAPVALYLAVTGSYAEAIVLVLIGVLVIGLVDNLLRPILVGRDTKIPDYIVLLSTLGGLALFGINGFVVGPLIAALFIASWGIFVREFQNQDGSAEPLKDQ
ncbi:MAG TPA: AI-2E family transporter [Marinagarivorans sp.]